MCGCAGGELVDCNRRFCLTNPCVRVRCGMANHRAAPGFHGCCPGAYAVSLVGLSASFCVREDLTRAKGQRQGPCFLCMHAHAHAHVDQSAAVVPVIFLLYDLLTPVHACVRACMRTREISRLLAPSFSSRGSNILSATWHWHLAPPSQNSLA